MSVTANLTTNVETITATIVVEDETIIAQVNTAARGPAGEAGPAVIDAATQSDGTADLDILNVETVNATVTDTLTAPHIHGNIAGSVYAHIRAGENLAKGDPVYVSSSHGSGSTLIPIVSKADASNAAKMPAIGIMDEAVANNANGHMVITGTITELNTAGLTVNAELYVAAGGGMTATPPTARAQPVARVERVNPNNGAVIVKVNGLSASDATGNTLVRRTSGGGASFAGVTLSGINTNSGNYSQVGGANFIVETTSNANLTTTGSGTVTVSGAGGTTISGGPLTISASSATFATGSISTSQPLALTQTWTNAAVPYTGLQVNVTDTASAAASLLMDLQVGGVSQFRVRKDGSTSIGSGGIPLLSVNATQVDLFGLQITDRGLIWAFGNSASVAIGAWTSGVGVRFGSSATLAWGNGGANTQNLDLILHRDAANTLAQRNGTAQQESRIYGTYTGAGDYRRLALKMSNAGVAQIVAEGAGSGAVGNVLQLPANTTFANAPATRTALGLGTGDSPTFVAASFTGVPGGANLDFEQGVNFRFGTTQRLRIRSLTVEVTANTSSTSTTTGAFTVIGGSGIGGNLFVGGTLSVTGASTFSTIQTGGYTFDTLPTPTTGMRAYITDGATSPVYMANASGGGSTVTPVFYNGTNWINA
jgi:hypothetical protein